MDNRKVFPPRKQKQRPLGPAPIASFENTSTDELKYEVKIIIPHYSYTHTHISVSIQFPLTACIQETERKSHRIDINAAIQLEWNYSFLIYKCDEFRNFFFLFALHGENYRQLLMGNAMMLSCIAW